jgi:exopolysaccharide biosynthesis polyprenyl glycosylphosphotransferase
MKKRGLSFLFQPIGFTINILVLNLSMFMAYYYTFHEFSGLLNPPYFLFFRFANISWIAVLAFARPFNHSRLNFNIPTLVFNYSKNIFFLLAFILLFWVSSKGYFYSRTVLLLTIILSAIFGYLWRIAAVYILRGYRILGYNNRTFAILGEGVLANEIKKYYLQTPELGFKNAGTFNLKSELNSPEKLLNLCKNNEIDVVYICLPFLEVYDIEKLVFLSEQSPVQLKIISDFSGFLKKGLSLEYHGNMPILNLSKKPYSDPKVEFIKRGFDISVSLIFIILLSPVFILVMIFTKLSSKGPIFYTQERIGRWGVPFRIIKFRSMYTDAEKHGPSLSIGNKDTRITPWGRFMRKVRLDEIPQFLNVLKGEMSIVGPRPERQFFIDQIVLEAPEYARLLTLKPGITSIGQIKYGYASTVAEMIKRMKYDLLYLKKYSIEIDLQILLLTIRVVFQGRGK